MANVSRLIIRGRVQGVYFRESMAMKARELKVTGWVRNRRDGSVEAMVQGTGEALGEIVAWARTGPDRALVESVQLDEGSGYYSRFDVHPSI
ncbi:MAG: acylphosphatase [Burkholderiales bacterium]|nr:acylphosphatase [Burkholderiales bacterium]MDQ3194829.1 acylphosphatase [Pseudomonadota bacterium]